MMTPLDASHKTRISPALALLTGMVAVMLTACSSVPGETLASGGVRRDITRKVLALADAAAPECKKTRIADTEVLEVFPDGKVAEERWSVEQCGTRAHYRVIFPSPAKKAAPVQVKPE